MGIEWNCFLIRRSHIEMANHFLNGGKGRVNQFSTNVTVRVLSPRLRDTNPPFMEKCIHGRDSNPGPPAFAAVALNH